MKTPRFLFVLANTGMLFGEDWPVVKKAVALAILDGKIYPHKYPHNFGQLHYRSACDWSGLPKNFCKWKRNCLFHLQNVCFGEKSLWDICNKSGEIIIPANRRMTTKLLREISDQYQDLLLDNPLAKKMFGICMEEYGKKKDNVRKKLLNL